MRLVLERIVRCIRLVLERIMRYCVVRRGVGRQRRVASGTFLLQGWKPYSLL